MLRISSLALFVAVFTLSSSVLAFASEKSNLNIPHTSQYIDVDAELNEPLWHDALEISLDIVNSPYDNTPSPVQTKAKIIENGEYLYISFEAFDPNPESIQAAIGKRDTKWFDDWVGIKMDPLNKKRTSYNFYVNAVGVQNDEIYDEINQVPNDLWDGIWHSSGKITESGYQVEIAIPFNILNFEQNEDVKTWPFELVRSYPRGTRLRLSHIPLDRDNNCWLCQYPLATGFEQAKIDKNITLTPSFVASNEQSKDIYDPQGDWDNNESYEASLDMRWNITPSSRLNATINPDFSTVETDQAQLTINETFSLFYDEKRPFFTENSEYFLSPQDLVYTRNIASPDYGAKLSGSENNHEYGVFISHDNQTNFIVSGNLSAQIASLNEESHSSAIRYRYSYDDDITLGAISTLRTADDYHNYVFGLDGSYRINQSDLITAQWLTSDTEYPDDLYMQFCDEDCQDNEQTLRTRKDGSFNDNALNIKYTHESEYWTVIASHEEFGEDFRADLGFIPRTDYSNDELTVTRYFYSDDTDSFWQTLTIDGGWNSQHSARGELISKELETNLNFDGPLLTEYTLSYSQAERVGLRLDRTSLDIDGNTDRFNEKLFSIYAQIRPTNKIFSSIDAKFGDKIDYENNRLGNYYEIKGNFTWNITHNIELDVYHTISELEADGSRVYLANLTDFRFTYQFDVHSYIKLTMVYSDIDQNPNNNPNSFFTEREKILDTQLIYTYKLNPQTAFYLGYSDSSYQDDYLNNLEREKRTFFAKVSYAWQP
jgi:Carbohydrate family 9 binding domain-like